MNAALIEDTSILSPPEDVEDTGTIEKDTLFLSGAFSLTLIFNALTRISIMSVCGCLLDLLEWLICAVESIAAPRAINKRKQYRFGGHKWVRL